MKADFSTETIKKVFLNYLKKRNQRVSNSILN